MGIGPWAKCNWLGFRRAFREWNFKDLGYWQKPMPICISYKVDIPLINSQQFGRSLVQSQGSFSVSWKLMVFFVSFFGRCCVVWMIVWSKSTKRTSLRVRWSRRISSWATLSASFELINSSGILWTACKFAAAFLCAHLESSWCSLTFFVPSFLKSTPQAAQRSFITTSCEHGRREITGLLVSCTPLYLGIINKFYQKVTLSYLIVSSLQLQPKFSPKSRPAR